MLKDNRHTLVGKSLILNSILIAINLLGLSFLVMGYHPSFEESAGLFKILGYSLMALTLVALFILEGAILFAYVARVIVGGLFIVSGLIKANDPKGFSYKLEEYFEDGALAYRIKDWFNWETFSLEFLIQYALALSVVILILEIVLGALILLGVKLRTSTWLMLLLMLFFTFLTWHTKECNPHDTFADVDNYALNSGIGQAKIAEAEFDEKVVILNQTETSVTVREIKATQCVEDCGCFGDAMKGSIGRSLTPAESFWKDIILLYLVVIIFISCRKIVINNARENIIMIISGLVFIGFFSYIFTWSFPIFFGLVSLLLAIWIKRVGGKLLGNEWGMIAMLIFTSAIFTTYVLMYLPLRDYRPYHVGSNLIERMSDGEEGVYENIMVYKNIKTGKDTTLLALDETTKAIWSDTENWEFSKRETKTIKAAILPSIQQFDPSISVDDLTDVEKSFSPIAQMLKEHQTSYTEIINKETKSKSLVPLDELDFFLEDFDTSVYMVGDTIMQISEDFTEVSLKNYILEQDLIFLIFARQLDKGDFSRIARLKEIAEQSKKHNIPLVLITTASKNEISEFREKTGLLVPSLQNDDIEIKAITRSNPTLMVLKNGVVKGKYPFRSTPSWKWLKENALNLKVEK